MTSAWRGLGGLDAYRITEIPRRPEAAETETPQRQPNDPGRMQRLAALIAAYHAGAGSKTAGAGATNDSRTSSAVWQALSPPRAA